MKQVKVLFVINSLQKGGGAEKTVARLADHLYAQGRDVEVLALYDSETRHEVNCVYSAVGARPRNSLDKLWRIPRTILYIRTFLKRKRVDHAICFLEEASFLTLASVLLGRSTIVVDISVRNSIRNLGIVYRIASRYLYRRARYIICVTKQIAADIKNEWGLSNTVVIYNGVDLEEARVKASEPLAPAIQDIFSKGPVVVAIGRLTDQKNYPLLLHAFDTLHKTHPIVQLLIVGEGEMEAELKSLAGKLGLNESVHFVGLQKNVYNILAKAQVYVLTSKYEGMPNTVLEAMAVGTPVVATDCVSGPRELLAPDLQIDTEIMYPHITPQGVLVSNIPKDAPLQVSGSIARYLVDHSNINHSIINDLFDQKTVTRSWEEKIIG